MFKTLKSCDRSLRLPLFANIGSLPLELRCISRVCLDTEKVLVVDGMAGLKNFTGDSLITQDTRTVSDWLIVNLCTVILKSAKITYLT